MSLSQKEVESLSQTVIEEIHFWLERRGSIHTYSKVHVSIACLSENGEEKHTGGQEEVQGIDGSQ